MKINYNLGIEEYFCYHPVITEKRKLKHETINKAALDLAKIVFDNLDSDDPEFDIFISQIQYIRMMLNQKVTIDELLED